MSACVYVCVNTLNTIMRVFVCVYKTDRKMINEPITLCGCVYERECASVCVYWLVTAGANVKLTFIISLQNDRRMTWAF
jgi:hypothetical protein